MTILRSMYGIPVYIHSPSLFEVAMRTYRDGIDLPATFILYGEDSLWHLCWTKADGTEGERSEKWCSRDEVFAWLNSRRDSMQVQA